MVKMNAPAGRRRLIKAWVVSRVPSKNAVLWGKCRRLRWNSNDAAARMPGEGTARSLDGAQTPPSLNYRSAPQRCASPALSINHLLSCAALETIIVAIIAARTLVYRMTECGVDRPHSTQSITCCPTARRGQPLLRYARRRRGPTVRCKLASRRNASSSG